MGSRHVFGLYGGLASLKSGCGISFGFGAGSVLVVRGACGVGFFSLLVSGLASGSDDGAGLEWGWSSFCSSDGRTG